MNVPELSGGNPVLGHIREFQKDPTKMLERGIKENGDLFEFRIGPKRFALFSGLDAHDTYFKAPEEVLDPQKVYQFTVPIFGRGVAYDVSSSLMTEQLGFLFPALRESSMKRFANIMVEEINLFADSMGESGELNLPLAMNELTVKIASHCFLGEEVRSEVDSGFAAAYHELQGGINTIGFFLPRLPIPSHRSRDRARREIGQIFKRIMRSRRDSNETHEDFMQTLMQSQYKDGRSLSDEEIVGLLVTALFAGQHTSAVLATWLALELLRDEPYIERIRQENRDTYGSDSSLTYEGLKQQTVIENSVREGERMHPPLIILLRQVLQPLEFRNQTVNPGTFAIVSPAASHRRDDLFEEPERFNPDRYCPPNGEDKQHPYALIGFGGGKHRCMGKNFAIMQIKAIWSMLFDRFDFEPVTSHPEPNYGSWVTGPVEPCLVRYRRRLDNTFRT